MSSRPLFLKALLLNVLAGMFLGGLAALYGGRLCGSTIIVIVAILAVFLTATGYAGRISWDADSPWVLGQSEDKQEDYCYVLMLRARWVYYAVWVCQIIGIMGTVFGFWLLLSGGTDTAQLADRIQEGGGVALAGTFVGVFCSLVLSVQHRLIESRLA